MTTSDWITVVGIAIGLFATTIGSTLFLAFKIGAVHEKVTSMERALEKITSEEIPWIKYTIAQMQVKLDVLWHFFMLKSEPSASADQKPAKASSTKLP